MQQPPDHALELQSTLSADGTLRIALAEVPVAPPGDDEVVVRVDVSPINPSDLMPMFASADKRRSDAPAWRPEADLVVLAGL